MKVIKIDVVNRRVERIDIKKGLEPLYEAIGNDCSLVEVPVVFPNDDAMFVDEEGYLKEQVGGFSMPDWRHPLTGNALIIGTGDEGVSVNAKSNLDDIRSQVTFYPIEIMEDWRKKIRNTPFTITNF